MIVCFLYHKGLLPPCCQQSRAIYYDTKATNTDTGPVNADTGLAVAKVGPTNKLPVGSESALD